MPTSLTRIAHHAPALVAFLLTTIAILLVTLEQGAKPFYHDSGGYWDLSKTFTQSGQFSLFNFENNGLRGYALPLLYWALRNIAGLFTNNESLVVRGFNAALFALVGTVLLPSLAALTWPRLKWSIGRRVALTALILLFWSGYLSFPLSDFPALAASLLALIAVSRAESPFWLFVAGISAGLAVNMRPAYILLVPLLVGLLIWNWVDQRGSARMSTQRHALGGLTLLVGFLLISAPQSISQHKQFGQYSPIPGSSDLTRLQYILGLELQRYDTYVSELSRIEYLDPHTEGIVAGLEDGRVSSTGHYLSIVASHPITMTGVFLRHVINGLDHRYTTPYVETLEADRDGVSVMWHRLLRIGGFLLVFLALLRVVWPTARDSLGSASWRYLAALLVASASSLPSAVETRFLLPVFVLSALLVVAPGWHRAFSEFRASPTRHRTLALVFGTGAVYAVIVCTVVAAATDNLRLS